MKIFGLQKGVIFMILVSSIMVFSIPEIFGENETESSSGVEFLEINIEPKNILVGDSIVVSATVINNSDTPISFQGGCDSPIWLEFLSDNVESVLIPGCQAQATFQIGPGQQKIVSGPNSGVLYKAISAGTLEAQITFAYGKVGDTASTAAISKTIELEINSEKEFTSKIHVEKKEISPRKQVSSGTNPQDVVCSDGLELIFKSTNSSPACVKPSTAEKLIKRGWARS